MLKIFNTLTKRKEIFHPINSGKIKMYVCGVTAYDFCHIGHGRTFVLFDSIIRYLRFCGYKIDYVRNITDVDDKIIKRSTLNNETIQQLTNRMIQKMHQDFDALNILRPTSEPKVSDYIDTIIKFISSLIQKKHAYITNSGDVRFAIKTFHNYGILSGLKLKKFKVHHKNKIFDTNNNIEDFVLWKSSKSGEPFWMSPWGSGRPGWHIECSAMNYAILGEQLDIHGGGSDLIFPHHENEIAQSVCVHEKSYANIWMHTGMLLLNQSKMSKSLNNLITINDMLNNYNAETIRYFLMSAHYRNSLQYTKNSLKSAHNALESLYIALSGIDINLQPKGGEKFISKFIDKMNDDFNIPEAYSILFEIAHKLNYLKIKQHSLTKGFAATLKYLANILGILYQNPDIFLKYATPSNYIHQNVDIIYQLINSREIARKKNQWKLADKIRNELEIMGIVLEDYSNGKTNWRYNFNKHN